MGRLILIVFSMLLVSCGTAKVRTEYVKVYINVPVVAKKPPVYEKLDIPVFHLTSKDPKVISETYYNSVVILLGEVKKRDIDLNVYRNFEIKNEGEK